MRFQVTYRVQRGKHKEVCEDAFLCGNQIAYEGSGILFAKSPVMICVGDGVGGNAGGSKASRFVMDEVRKLDEIRSSEDLKERLVEINERLLAYAEQHAGQDKMATTLTGVLLQEEKGYLAHCGNTRLYVTKGSYLKQITEDHTTYQWLMSNGNQSAAEVCNRSEILGAFGGGKSSYLNKLYVENVFEKGIPHKMLLTSDGIHDYVGEDEMESIVSGLEAEEAVDKLIENALQNGSGDDCTVAIIEAFS